MEWQGEDSAEQLGDKLVQSEVMWPAPRPSAQQRESRAPVWLSQCLSPSVLMLKSALGSIEVLSAVSVCQRRSESLQSCLRCARSLSGSTEVHSEWVKGGIQRFLPLPNKYPTGSYWWILNWMLCNSRLYEIWDYNNIFYIIKLSVFI